LSRWGYAADELRIAMAHCGPLPVAFFFWSA